MDSEIRRSRFRARPAHLKWTAFVAAAIILLAGGISTLQVQYREAQSQIAGEGARRLAEARAYYRAALTRRARKLLAVAESLAANPALGTALARQDRQALLDLTGPLFQRLRQGAGISHLYFHDAGRINLLRVHEPGRHGDPVERYTARRAEETGAAAWGVELGPLGTFTLRLVLPVRGSDAALLGYVELGQEIGELLPEMARLTGLDALMLVRKHLLHAQGWRQGMALLGRPADWDLLPDFVVAAATLEDLPRELLQGAAGRAREPPGSVRELGLGERTFQAGTLPLEDASGRPVGALVLLRDLTAHKAHTRATLMRQAAVGLGASAGILLLLFLVLGRFQRRLDHQLDQLRDSRRRLLTAHRMAHLGEWEWDARSGELRCTPEVRRLLGSGRLPRSLEDLLAHVPPQERPALEAQIAAAGRGEPAGTVEHRIVTGDGSVREVVHHVAGRIGARGHGGVRGALLDITRVRQAEGRAGRLGRAIEASRDEVYMFDPRTLRFTEVNSGVCRNTGYSLEELLQMTPLDLKRDLDRAGFEELLAPLRQGEQGVIQFECTHWRKDGSHYPVEVRLQYARELHEPMFIALVHDISARLESRERIQAVTRRLQHILDSSPAVHYAGRVEGRCLVPTFVAARLRDWGYEPEAALGDAAWWQTCLHPEDREPVRARLAEVMASGARHYAHEYRFRTRAGSYLWIHDEMTIERDDGGRPVEVIGSWLDITEQRRMMQDLEHQALYDTLTGLPNRALLQDRLQHAIQEAARGTRPLAVVAVDLARLKEVNDSLGYENGDRVLREVAERLRATVRECDTVARIGGDEFGLILQDVGAVEASVVADKIFAAMDEPLTVDGTPVMLEVVLGVAVWPEHGSDAAELLQHADVGLRRAKAEAVPWQVYSRSANPFSRRRLHLLADLRRALDRDDELQIHIQPKVDLRNGRVIGGEALARWAHPGEGMVSPAEFIPLAESSGLIGRLSDWALREGVRQLDLWQQQGLEGNLAINLSTRNLQEPDLAPRIDALLRRHGVPPRRLSLEITETGLMHRPDLARKVLGRLHATGVRLSIDDFGTGYSSLSYLKALPVDDLKIDTSFVMHMLEDDSDAVLVRTIIDLAHDLGLGVVAEGVENQDIIDLLVILGCDVGQGYHIARPMPAAEFLEWWQALPRDRSGHPGVPELIRRAA